MSLRTYPTRRQSTSREEIIEIAYKSLRAAYDQFPMGCDEDDMKAFLETQPFPEVAYAVLTMEREAYLPVVDKYVVI